MGIYLPWENEDYVDPIDELLKGSGIEIGEDDRVYPGDKLQIKLEQRFSMGQSLDTWLLGTRISELEKDPRFILDGYDWISDENKEIAGAVLRVTVNPDTSVYPAGSVWITPAVIITILLGLAALMFSISIYRVADAWEDTASTPAVKAISAGVPILAAATLIYAVYLWVKK